jgi:UDP-2,3-diacylglucosamine hydrolase
MPTPDPSPPVPARVASIDRLTLQAPVFVSDLHLSSARVRTVERFLRLLAQRGGQAGELLILGDLFEFWAGDDTLEQHSAEDELARAIAQALQRLAATGTQIYLMHGNRDLLLGEGFLQASGAQLLADPCIATLPGCDDAPSAPILLSHGDAYCTQDLPYQAFRRQARDPRFQSAFLARALDERRALLGQARQRSEAGKRQMAQEIMDVTASAIDAAMREAGVRSMIHGHTHRPARHEFLLDDQSAVRWVLPDWELDDAPTHGGGLRWHEGKLESFSI